MSEISKIIDGAINQTKFAMIDAAIEMINVELGNPETLNSKVACDALRRVVNSIQSLRVPFHGE